MLDEHEQVVAVIISGDEKSLIQVGAFVDIRPSQLVKRLLVRKIVRKSGLPSSARATKVKVKVFEWIVMMVLPHCPIGAMNKDEPEQNIPSPHRSGI